MVARISRIRQSVAHDIERNGNDGHDGCRENQQVRIIQEEAAHLAQDQAQRRRVDAQAQAQVGQRGFQIDGARDGQCHTQDDNGDQIRQDVLGQHAPQRGAQAAGREVVLAVTEHEHHVADTACHRKPVDGDHGDGHDPEALAHHQGDQGHIDDIGHVVDQVVQLREEAVQTAHIAPDQAEDHAHDALAHGDHQSQTDGNLGGIPHLAPVVTAQVVGTEPVLSVGPDESLAGIRDQAGVVILADAQRNEGEHRQRQEQDQAEDSDLLLEEVLDDRTPVGIVGVADTLSFFRGIIHKVEQFFGLLALKIRCLSHQRASSFPVRVIRGSTTIISTSPRNTPTMPSTA